MGRRLIEYTVVSADGVYENPARIGLREYQDDAYVRDGLGLMTACEALLFGRRTYEGFAKAWPGSPWADRLNAIPKYVFSSTLEKADWNNSTVVRGDVVTEVTSLKQREGGDLLILGHGLLGETLLREQLIDVIDLSIYPVVLGQGKQFFGAGQDAKLRLVATKTFSNIVKVTYEPQLGDGDV
jgi:dihydrofolate reductase